MVVAFSFDEGESWQQRTVLDQELLSSAPIGAAPVAGGLMCAYIRNNGEIVYRLIDLEFNGESSVGEVHSRFDPKEWLPLLNENDPSGLSIVAGSPDEPLGF